MNITAYINPRTRKVKMEFEGLTPPQVLKFEEDDEWTSFTLGDKVYDAHYYIEDVITTSLIDFCVYEVDEDGHNSYDDSISVTIVLEGSMKNEFTLLSEYSKSN